MNYNATSGGVISKGSIFNSAPMRSKCAPRELLAVLRISSIKYFFKIIVSLNYSYPCAGTS